MGSQAVIVRAALGLFLGAGVSSSALAVNPNVVETFSGGLGGWGGGSGPTLVNSGGPAGDGDAYLRISSTGGFGNLATLNTGADWTGNYGGNISIPGESLILGVRANLANFGSTPLSMRVIFFNTANNRYSTLDVAEVPADGVWREYMWSFDPVFATGLVNVQGAVPIVTGMQNVTQIMFRHNINPSAGGDNVSGTLGLDNIRLVPFVPAPGAMTVLGLGGLVVMRRRRSGCS
jgi:hypothetical protein